ncbi:MAG: radical SAM family heme chaperone HemW [Bacteroidetes bacterium]|nr:radical SAM family heme chaperone HemW [Bacteroidota bacterium]
MAGIYLHIPFCKQRCTYCDFHFSTSYQNYQDQMIEAMVSELIQRKSEITEKIETIYLGGGTPSLLDKKQLKQLLETIQNNYSVIDAAELTLEANPDDILPEHLVIWKELGINRLSIGLQSFRPEDLKWMNRAHSAEEAKNCVPLAQKMGFKNLTIDLMYGLPNLSLQEWEQNIQTVIDFSIPHISAYCLTVEERTVLDKKVANGEIKPLSEEEQSEQFQMLTSKLLANGYEQYEISNFSKPGMHAKHNTAYWQGVPYIGIGPSAHSFDGNNRRFNVPNNAKYMNGIHSGQTIFEAEVLTSQNKFNEKLMTGLRTKWGVDLKELDTIHTISDQFKNTLEDFINSNWVMKNKSRILLTETGKLMADHISSSLFA